jgi:hypothetical protein
MDIMLHRVNTLIPLYPILYVQMVLKPLFLYIMHWEHFTWAVVIQSLWVLQHTTLIHHSIVSPLTGRHNKAFSVYSPAWSIANRELENLSSPIF